MFERMKTWLKGVGTRMLGISTTKQTLGQTALSPPMDNAIKLWMDLYRGRSPWRKSDAASLNLPAFIASEVSRITTIEMQSTVSGSPRADYLNEQYQPVVDKARLFTEYAAAAGTVILKPYIDGTRIRADCITPRMFTPTRFSSSGEITGCVFATEICRGGKTYTRLETHELNGGNYSIACKAFVSDASGDNNLGVKDIGREIPLSSVPEWADIEPLSTFGGLERPLFAVFKMPGANPVDPSSSMGASVFALATDLIHEADEQFTRLIWEMESGERALFVDAVALDRDVSGLPILPNKRLYRTLKTGQTETLFEGWSPTLRQKDQIEALDAILRRIEDACGLARGSISQAPESAAGGSRTATELRIMRQRTYALVVDTQKMLRTALEDLLEAMDAWATIANLAQPGEYSTSFDFDDSVVSDRQTEFAERMQLLASGILQGWEMRMWYLGEDEATAKAAVAQQGDMVFGSEE